jgi:hypothetical protein
MSHADMRTVIAIAPVLAVLGCAQRSTPEESDPAPEPVRADQAQLAAHSRAEVPPELAAIAAGVTLGLPLGTAPDVDISLVAPRATGGFSYARANGTIGIAVGPTSIGDGATPLNARGQELPFGRLQIDKLDARFDVRAGTAELTRWELQSKDLELGLRIKVALADDLARSAVDGCVWFKPAADLVKREPKTYAVLLTTGAIADGEGYFSIKVGGTVGATKLLAQACRVLPASAAPTPAP